MFSKRPKEWPFDKFFEDVGEANGSFMDIPLILRALDNKGPFSESKSIPF